MSCTRLRAHTHQRATSRARIEKRTPFVRTPVCARSTPPDADSDACSLSSPWRFEGTKRLYGAERFAALERAHVLVIGLGGVGSWAVEALARSGIGALTLADLDDVCETNVNRQVAALTSTVGMSKAHVLAKRVRDINPDCDVRIVEDFVQGWNVEAIVERGEGASRAAAADGGDADVSGAWRRPDYVLDAIDKERDKAAIVAYCVHARVPLCVTGGAGGLDSLQDVRADDLSSTTFNRLASMTRKTLRKEYNFPKDVEGPSFPGGKKGASKKASKSSKWGVKCVYAPENQNVFKTAGTKGRGGIGCDGVGGSAVFVTGAIGFKAASEIALDLMQEKTSSKDGPATTGWRSRVWPSAAVVAVDGLSDALEGVPRDIPTSAASDVPKSTNASGSSESSKELAPSKRDASQPTSANLAAAATLDSKEMYDAHCHWHLDGERNAVRELCARLAGACMTTTRPVDWDDALAIREGDQVVNVPVACGVHPWWAHLEKDTKDAWMARLRDTVTSTPSCVVGEIGLDKVAVPPDADADYENQLDCFARQLALATELRKPVVVHCVKATGDMQTMFRQASDLPPRIYMHSFGGSSEFLRQLTTLKKYGDRFYFGFSSVINLRSPKTQDVIRATPDDRLLLESDLCDPTRAEDELRIMLAFIADVKGWSVSDAARITRENAERFYGE